MRVRSPQPVERDVTLSYITNNFDWQADYVGDLSADGRTLSLFAWLTMANGDDTGLVEADTNAVAGKLNRERVGVSRGGQTDHAIVAVGTTMHPLEVMAVRSFSGRSWSPAAVRGGAAPPPPRPNGLG